MNILNKSGEMIMATDEVEYVIRPSQWINIGYFLIVPAMMYLFWDYPYVWGLFGFVAFWRYLEVYYWRFEVRDMTIVERKGVLSITKEEIHYYRIKSIKYEQPFLLRIVGLSIVYVITSEAYKPEMKLYAITDGETMRNLIKNKTFYWKQKMNISDIDLFNTN
jgi:membrane protein YdbS with pleckstrin-like domain